MPQINDDKQLALAASAIATLDAYRSTAAAELREGLRKFIAAHGIAALDTVAGAIATALVPPVAPTIVNVPTISDTTPNVGNTLTATAGAGGVLGTPAATNLFEWFVGGVSQGGRSATLVVTSAMLGQVITVKHRRANALGEAVSTSAATTAVAA